jgi:peptidoglycan/LPS O-acetylase OafA/YrhL
MLVDDPRAPALTNPGVSERYVPEIDGLRAVAFLGVLVSHYIYDPSWAGSLGVDLFFVISGFLITDILLAARLEADIDSKRARRLFNFYIRRAIRLWPLLYLTIGITLLVFSPARASWQWHVLQISNVRFVHLRGFSPWPFAHFWSLNVEEQYYLLWPLAVFFLPRKAIGPFLAVLGIAGVIWLFTTSNRIGFLILLPDNVVPIAIGGILALYGRTEALQRVLRMIGPIGLVAAILLLAPQVSDAVPNSTYPAVLLLTSVGFAYLVNGARGTSLGYAGKLLASRPFVAIGRITYGAYVIHLLVLWVFIRIGLVNGYGLSRFLICTPVVLVLARLSWVYFERPLNRLKAHYPVS